jgi:ribonuclease HII
MPKSRSKFLIGIDEVGRGALAGPVLVAAVVIPAKLKTKNLKLKTPLRDSKKITSRQREIWFRYITKELALPHAVAMVSPIVIDKINISQAANLAASCAFIKLITNYKLSITKCKILLDGGLHLNKLKTKNSKLKTKTIIRGDEKISVISLASIVAKITRDKLMKKLHKKYPQYDFIHNVGYGTKKHIKAIHKFGLSSIHRKSFALKID